jgi:hypothetical protein
VKTSVSYTPELVNSYFHLCGRGKNHNRIDANALAVGTADVDEDHLALYSGYYDCSSSHGL